MDGPGTSGQSGPEESLGSQAPKPEAQAGEAQSNEPVKPEEEEVDIDLNDPDVADAAAKIQAGFKKHMLKKKK